MSERLYYFDAYTTQFNATIIERIQNNGRYAVVLDKTFFYPESGGQPSDLGNINGILVLEATIRKEDDSILHWTEREVDADEVEIEINWERRFDHMQQHSGQHILSQAFIQVADAQTVSFHLSDDSVTIDLHKNDLSAPQIEQAELLANQIVWDNRPVKIHMVTSEQALNLPIRKIPALNNGTLRLIEIDDFDMTACGGTHVSHTGEIGIIKLIKLERRRDKLRVEFCCGRRALQDFEIKNIIVNELSGLLTTGNSEIVNAVNRLQEEVKQTRRIIKKQEAEILSVKAHKLIQSGKQAGNITIVSHVLPESDSAQLKALATQLVKNDGVIAFLGLSGSRAQLLFSRSTNAPGKMNQLLESALQILGPASGGGNASFAQGGGPSANIELVTQAISRAESILFEQL